MEKLLTKGLAPASLVPVLIYPTAPNRLLASDIPGYHLPQSSHFDDGETADEPDTWAWFRKHEATGTYRFLDEGMATIAQAIRDAGGIDGVCGFSQGGAMSAVVAAAMEPDRTIPEGKEGDWAKGLRDANGGKGLKFAVSWAGFWGPVDMLKWCYSPKIKTPMLHILGSLDTVVEESRSSGLVDRCEDPLVVTHPGGHHVPVAKEWVMPLAGFIKERMQDDPKAGL